MASRRCLIFRAGSDLLSIVRDHIYQFGLRDSFSIKNVLPPLVAGLSYEDLKIQGGGTASVALAELLLGENRAASEHDTLAMVRLHEGLRILAGLRFDQIRACP